ncbi:MAG: hypothetical protein ACO1OT_07685, partial [Heyndrickxia sp.]
MKKIGSLIAVFCLIGGLFIPKNAHAQGQSPFENLGPQVEYTNAIRGKVGYNSSGQPLYYTLLQGEPAKLVVIDINSNSVYDIQELSGSSAAWSIDIGTNQNVYIGGTPSEHLYRYNPDQKAIEDLGKATTSSKDTVIWDLAYDHTNDRVFGV